MATEQGIKIPITTTADPSGAIAIEKAIKQVDEATKALEQSAEQASESLDQIGDQTGRTEAAAGGKRGAAQGVKELADEAPKAGEAAKALGQNVRNAGYQVQDFAVQVASGQSAVTAFAQQAPQFLGSFGPQGAVAGALIALGALAYNVFKGVSEVSDKTATEVDAKWNDLVKKREESTRAAMNEAVTSYLSSLDDEEEAIKRVNDQLDRNIALMQARRRAEAEVASAQDALDLAKIDSNKDMTDEEKIRARAEIGQRAARRKAENDIANINDRDVQSALNLKRANEAAGRASDDTESQRREVQALEEERRRLKGKVAEADAAKASLPFAEKALADAAYTNDGSGEFSMETPEQMAKREQAIAAAQKKLDEIRRQIEVSQRDREMLSALDGSEGKKGALETAREGLQAKEEAERVARAKAAEQGDIREVERKANEAAASSVASRFGIDRERLSITSESAAEKAKTDADERKRKQAEMDAEKEKRRKEREEAATDDIGFGGAKAGRDAAKVAEDSGLDSGAAVLRKAAEALEKRPSASGAKDLANLVERLLKAVEAREGKDSDQATRIKQLERQLDTLERRLLNTRS